MLKLQQTGSESVEPHDVESDFLYTKQDIGKPKLEVLKSALEAMNPHNSVQISGSKAIEKSDFSGINAIVYAFSTFEDV